MPPSLTGLWRHPDFLKLWAGQSVSMTGTQITALALPLTAALVLDATAAQMGLLGALGTLPFLLIRLFAGVCVDRLRRRPILIASDLARALLLASIPLAAALDRLRIEHLYAVALFTGLLTVFFDVAYQSFLPSLVERRHLVEGNSKLEISSSTARVVGPGLGGVLVQVAGAPAAILADSLSFLLSALFVGAIRRTEPPPVAKAGRRSVWSEIGEGLRVTLRHPLLCPIMASTALSNLGSGIVAAVFVLFVTRTLALEPSLIGLSYAAGSLGAVAGAALATRLTRRFGLGPSLLAGKLLIALSALLIPLAGGPVSLAFLVLTVSRFFGSGGTVVSNVNQVSLRQAITPDHLQGRVNATNRFLVWGTLPLGTLIGGVLGELAGIRPTIAVGAAGMTLAAVWLRFSPLATLRDTPAEEREVVAV